jgi:hypothetical protein
MSLFSFASAPPPLTLDAQEPEIEYSDSDLPHLGMPLDGFAEAFANHAVSVNPRESRPKAVHSGRMYRVSQAKECNSLYNNIISSVKEPLRLLYLLEQLYSTLEYLCIPLPKGFQDLFATVAFKCLPTRVFVQYMERGVVVIGRRFVMDVLSPALAACDIQLINHITTQSNDLQEAIFVLQQSKPHILYLIQYLLSAYFAAHLIAQTKSGVFAKNMDISEDAQFIPLSAFLHLLNSVCGPTHHNFEQFSNKSASSGSFGNLGLVSLWNSLPYMGVTNNSRTEKRTRDVEVVLKQLLELINQNCGHVLDQIVGVIK